MAINIIISSIAREQVYYWVLLLPIARPIVVIIKGNAMFTDSAQMIIEMTGRDDEKLNTSKIT